MDLTTFTDGQRKSVTHLGGPLLVSAGAGSGKTFTLTQRIAYALLPESGPFAQDIDQIMAITFTEKAASEIKARVKRTLSQEGLHEQALRVDGAWISTIHGACARILRAHALELGIDPKFGILSEAQRLALVSQAVSEALDAARTDPQLLGYGLLLREYDIRAKGMAASSVQAMLEALMGKLSGMAGGLESLVTGPGAPPAGIIARRLVELYRAVGEVVALQKESSTSEKAARTVADSLDALEAYLSSGKGEGDYEALAQALDRCGTVGRNFGSKECKALVADFQQELSAACAQVVLGLAAPAASQLVSLTAKVGEIYERLKTASGSFDNDDLMMRTLRAFSDHPQIAAYYRDKFKLVMVDEFQDTSQLQIDLVSFLAGEHLERLCTVGDSQQSIYRFRGADVNVYEAHKQTMASPQVGALGIQLSKNFRSHRDVLSFVDRIFEQDRSFGRRFMSLEPNLSRESLLAPGLPRIQVELCSYAAQGEAKVSSSDAVRASAMLLARRFAEYRQAGHSASSMVVLLGRMTNAPVFASALRDEGFECIVAGGSSFAGTVEVQVIASLLRALANPLDTRALFQVLASGMFGLTAEELLELATAWDGEGFARTRSLAMGLMSASAPESSGRPAGTNLSTGQRAAVLFSEARARLRSEPASVVASQLVAASGWLLRLEAQGAQGRAEEANVLKALRLASSLEEERKVGPAALAKLFEAELAALKEPPGALSGSSSEAVRIMTIHSSKGLEFPIVGVAEFTKDAKLPPLVAETVGRHVFMSLKASRSADRFANLFKIARGFSAAAADDREDAADAEDALLAQRDALSYRTLLEQRVRDEELAEGRRKLYVALTRASEALVVSMVAKESKSAGYPELIEDFRCALFGDEDFPSGEALCDIGAEQPCLFRRTDARSVLVAARDCGTEAAGAEGFPVLDLPLACDAGLAPWAGMARDAVSYSFLSRTADSFRGPSDLWASSEGEGSLPLEPPSTEERLCLDDDEPDCGGRPSDEDKATDFGIAFHRAAEYCGKTGSVPSDGAVGAIARSVGLSDAGTERLRRAVALWFDSPCFREASRYSSVRSEVPFLVSLGEGMYLEGEIDLLCTDGDGKAFVVDYKTGRNRLLTEDDLLRKHRLQAQSYAYALLVSGYEEVELRFVYVEQPQDEGGLRSVGFRFAEGDRLPLGQALRAAAESAL